MGKSIDGKDLGTGITQRKDGTYMGRYVDRFKKRHTIYNKDLRALKRELEKERYEAQHSVWARNSAITLEKWFEDFLILYKIDKVKDVTVYRIRQTFAPCKKHAIGGMKLIEIRAVHIQDFINKLYNEEDYSYATLNVLKALLKELFRTAIGNGFMVINPCDAVVLPKREIFEPRFLTEFEQKMFLDAAKGYYYYDIYCFALSCGARIGEILGLKWCDIDFENKTIQIRRTLHYAKVNENEKVHFFFTTPKTKTSERTIPMLPATEEILLRVRKEQIKNKKLFSKKWDQKEPFEHMVFTTKYGTPVRYGDVNRTIKIAVAIANVQEEELAKIENREPYELRVFSPHCFRHTFITRCKENGVPYEIIQPYVGHSTKEMTEYYNHHKESIDDHALKGVDFGVV